LGTDLFHDHQQLHHRERNRREFQIWKIALRFSFSNFFKLLKISCKQILFLLLCFSTQLLSARENPTKKDSILPHNFVEVGYGIGMVNSRFTMAAGFIDAGYGNVIVTARLCRSSGKELRGYIFEDAFMMGYRFHFGKSFNTTLSGGYSDLAFEKGYHTYFDATPDMFKKTNGFSLQAEAEWEIPRLHAASPVSICGIYYTTFNPKMNLNGFVIGMKFCFERYGKHWYDK